MTREEFEHQTELACKHCGAPRAALVFELAQSGMPHEGGKVLCRTCGAFQFWLKKPKNELRRPPLKAGALDEVWEGTGNHCAHCGLSATQLAALGIGRTVQHVPPYVVVGDEGYTIPLCEWCQQDSASRMKRLTSLVTRLADKLGMK